MKEWRKAWRVLLFETLGYKIYTDEVKRFHESHARMRICSAPARTSKSYSAAMDEIVAALEPAMALRYEPENAQSIRTWIVAPNFQLAKEFDYIYREIVVKGLGKQLAKQVKHANSPGQGHMFIHLHFGMRPDGEPVETIIEVKSSANEQALQAEEVHRCVMSEAAEQEEKIYARYLSTRVKKITLPTTPKLSAEWIRELIRLSEDRKYSIEHFQFTPHCNPTYDWERYQIEQAKAASRTTSGKAEDDPWFAEQFLGHWTGEDERALPFRADPLGNLPAHVLHEMPEWCQHAKSFVSIDYGFDDPAAALFWAVGEMDQLVVLGEIYERKMDTYRFVSAVHDKARSLGLVPDYYVGDPKKPEVAELMRRRGLPVWDRDKYAMADRAAGFMALVDALSTDARTGLPRLRVLSERAGAGYGAPNLVREWRLLRRKKKHTGEEWSGSALVGDDHAMDAARYGIQTRPRPHEYHDEKDWLIQHRRNMRRRQPPPLRMLYGGRSVLLA